MHQTDAVSEDQGHGLRDEYPKVSGVGIATGVGALWGLLCYSVLWDGMPFGVDRRFVESVLGTLVLLPARLVLWMIRGIELATDRTFDFSDNHLWIAFAISAAGATLAVGGFLFMRSAFRRLRRVRTRRRVRRT